ncbi:putative aldouronate transport system substrate-binding protein [Paenibacillus sp. BK033]|uniref:extracellular solute-binding protein n=1 Tax=Paenibacillus sp. BK033 TaxID=2512133 RepID=UPI00104EADF0|nr:extracellular solute-binding protein [Paenibacillus sp. BK033]TCM99103.1 putative aldouronate transport system substrate-binding protein [Paenibacillus sp. BK033]
MNRKKWLILLSMTALLGVSACSGGNNGPSPNTATEPDNSQPSAESSNASATDGPFAKYEDTVKITLGRQGVSGNNLPAGDTLEDNEYLRYVEERLNVDVQYEFSVEDLKAYNQKVTLAIASNNIPDVMIVDEQQFHQLAKANMLADLTDIYEDYASPLIKEYYNSYTGDRVLNTGKIDGKLYALPNTNIDGNFQLLWIRKDWLDKLQLQLPKTVDDVKGIVKAFVEQDPDGNGAKDTTGLLGDPTIVGDGGFFTFDPIFNAYHSYPKSWFKDEEGNIFYGSTTPETKQALGVLRDMYANGLIDKEFLTRKWEDNAGLVSSGRAGILFAPWFAGWAMSDAVKANANADWVPLAVPLDDVGQRNIVPSVPSGSFLVVNKNAKNPEAVLKVLNVEYEGIRLIDPATQELYKGQGVGWLNYPLNLQLDFQDSLARDIPIYDKVLQDKDKTDLPARILPRVESLLKNHDNPKQDMAAYADSLAFYTAAAVTGAKELKRIDPVFYGNTETMLKRGANLDKLENETFLKIITGSAPLDEFDKFVSTWKSIGGDQVAKEIGEIVKQK